MANVTIYTPKLSGVQCCVPNNISPSRIAIVTNTSSQIGHFTRHMVIYLLCKTLYIKSGLKLSTTPKYKFWQTEVRFLANYSAEISGLSENLDSSIFENYSLGVTICQVVQQRHLGSFRRGLRFSFCLLHV